jgi:hypothetical protein
MPGWRSISENTRSSCCGVRTRRRYARSDGNRHKGRRGARHHVQRLAGGVGDEMHMEDISAAAVHNGTPYGLRVICRQVLRPAGKRLRLAGCRCLSKNSEIVNCRGPRSTGHSCRQDPVGSLRRAHNSWPLASLQTVEAKTEFASQAVLSDYPLPCGPAGTVRQNLWTRGNSRDSPLNNIHQERVFLSDDSGFTCRRWTTGQPVARLSSRY